jgi:hypothetical protein
MGSFGKSIVFTTVLVLAPAWAVLAQESNASDRQGDRQTDRQSSATERQGGERRTVGTVTSIGRGSVVVRSDQGGYSVFSIGPGTRRPRPVAVGEHVSVVSLTDDRDDAPTALAITVVPRPQGLASPTATDADAVPEQVRRLEGQIERQARRYRLGVQAGAALDPELISLDVFGTFGPFFSPNIHFRPNAEFAFGEVTTLFGIHLDGLYTLPNLGRSRWAPYVGAGPSFTFSHRSLEGDLSDLSVQTTSSTVNNTINNNDTGGRFDFGEFEWHNGVNFIVGARRQNGTFFEMKSTAWGAANIRLMAGFEF